jgi:hypothetical protein
VSTHTRARDEHQWSAYNQRPRGEAEIDFEKRRAAARRQSSYRRRLRRGRIVIALEVYAEDLIAAGLRRGLLATAERPAREELERIGALILQEAIQK